MAVESREADELVAAMMIDTSAVLAIRFQEDAAQQSARAERRIGLLFKGSDFSQTDIAVAET